MYNNCPIINLHELQKQEIFKQSNDESNSFRFGLVSPQAANNTSIKPTEVGFEDIELYFDSIYRDRTTNLSSGELKWSIPILNLSFDIKNCIQLHLGEFYFPNLPSTNIDYFYYRRVFMECQDVPNTQGVLAFNNNRFHFEFEVSNITGQAVKLTPIKKSFFFQRPIQSISNFQIRFMVPQTNANIFSFNRIPIPNDVVSISMVLNGLVGFNPIRFQLQNETTDIIGPIGVLVTPVAVTISNFNSNSLVVNSQINTSVLITNILTQNTFEIAGINSIPVNAVYGATMLIMKNRIAFAMRFTSVKDTTTNYIDVNHD